MPDTFVKNNLSIVISFIVAVFGAGGIFAEFTALKDEIHLVHERLDEKIVVITKLEDRILTLEKQLEYERGFLEANKKINYFSLLKSNLISKFYSRFKIYIIILFIITVSYNGYVNFSNKIYIKGLIFENNYNFLSTNFIKWLLLFGLTTFSCYFLNKETKKLSMMILGMLQK